MFVSISFRVNISFVKCIISIKYLIICFIQCYSSSSSATLHCGIRYNHSPDIPLTYVLAQLSVVQNKWHNH